MNLGRKVRRRPARTIRASMPEQKQGTGTTLPEASIRSPPELRRQHLKRRRPMRIPYEAGLLLELQTCRSSRTGIMPVVSVLQKQTADDKTAHHLGLNNAEHALQDQGFDGYLSPTHPAVRFHFGDHDAEPVQSHQPMEAEDVKPKQQTQKFPGRLACTLE